MYGLKKIIFLIKPKTLCAKADEGSQVGRHTDPARQETTAEEDQTAVATTELGLIRKP